MGNPNTSKVTTRYMHENILNNSLLYTLTENKINGMIPLRDHGVKKSVPSGMEERSCLCVTRPELGFWMKGRV